MAGPRIGHTVRALVRVGKKSFGISSSLRHICAACIPANLSFFRYDWKKEAWNLFFVTGILLGGILSVQFLNNPEPIEIHPNLEAELAGYGISEKGTLLPPELFNAGVLFSAKGIIMMVIGGFLVGFGTRYAGGCTSGHSIMGISNLQLPSLIATCCFMIGGFIMANLILPHILRL